MEDFDYKKYLLRIIYALFNKDLPVKSTTVNEAEVVKPTVKKPNYILPEETRLKQQENDITRAIYYKTHNFIVNGQMKSVHYQEERLIPNTINVLKYLIDRKDYVFDKNDLKIEECYLDLFTPKQREFIKANDMLFKAKSSPDRITVKRSNGKPLTIRITSHARARFMVRCLLIKDILPSFEFNEDIENALTLFKKWFKDKIESYNEIGLTNDKTKDMIITEIANSRQTFLNDLISKTIRSASYGNEKSKHYKYRDKNGCINFYRTYPFTFVMNINDNSIVTTEIYAINDGVKNRDDIVSKVNGDVDKLFYKYLDQL